MLRLHLQRLTANHDTSNGVAIQAKRLLQLPGPKETGKETKGFKNDSFASCCQYRSKLAKVLQSSSKTKGIGKEVRPSPEVVHAMSDDLGAALGPLLENCDRLRCWQQDQARGSSSQLTSQLRGKGTTTETQILATITLRRREPI